VLLFKAQLIIILNLINLVTLLLPCQVDLSTCQPALRIGEDVDAFIERSVLGASRNRDVIIDFIRHEKFTRPTSNLARNAGNIDGNDFNVLFYTLI